MTLSIITSTYNNEVQLKELYASLLAQSEYVHEWIICDDHSSDLTASFIDAYALHCPFDVYYVIQQNKGARYAKNLNNGIKLSSGELLFFINGDSYPDKDALKILHGTYIKGSSGSALRVDIDKDKKFMKYDWRVPDGNDNIIDLAGFTEPWNMLTGNGMIVSKKDIEAIDLWDEKYVGYGKDDWDVFLRLYMAKVPLYQYNNVRINHFYHGEGKEDSEENTKRFISKLKRFHLL